FELAPQPFAAEKAHSRKRHVHKAYDALPRQAAGEIFHRLELAGCIGSPDQGPDRCAGDEVRMNPLCLEFEQDANMRPAARAARAKPDTKPRPARGGDACGAFVSAHAVIVLAEKRPHLVQL